MSDSSPTSSPPKMSLAEFGRDLARRCEAARYPEVPRNAGSRRTESKRALLAAIDAAGDPSDAHFVRAQRCNRLIVMKAVDWMLDLSSKGSVKGDETVAIGTPEMVEGGRRRH